MNKNVMKVVICVFTMHGEHAFNCLIWNYITQWVLGWWSSIIQEKGINTCKASWNFRCKRPSTKILLCFIKQLHAPYGI